MKSEIETLSPTRIKLSVEIPFEELQPSLDEALTRIGKEINIPGFRKGKVPARVVEQRVGRGAVLEEAVNNAVPKAYDELVVENELRPIGQPKIDVTQIADGEKVTFTAEVDVRPEFTLPAFDSLTVEVEPVALEEADVVEQIDSLRGRFANLVEVDRASADGDVLLVNIGGKTDSDDEVEDLSASAMSYELGTEGMLPGLDEAVRGASKGESRTFEFTPQNGDWSGIPLTVAVEVTAVRERELPALDAEFVSMASEFDTVEELRADIETRLGRLKRVEQGAEARNKIHDVLLEQVELPLPEGLIAAEIEGHFQDGHDSGDEHRAEVETEIRTGLKSQFILDKIAEDEELTVGESELSAWLMQQAPRYEMSPDAFAQALMEAGQVPMAMADIRRAKALAKVLESAKVVDTNGVAVDLSELDSEMAALTGSA
ncbi:MAG TPA: trigger factor [Actinobacteria bacterium]|nr:trigger factor [Actinomycetota bacterium]HBK38709.1 trigger factor [Actinomycetota bacterium]